MFTNYSNYLRFLRWCLIQYLYYRKCSYLCTYVYFLYFFLYVFYGCTLYYKSISQIWFTHILYNQFDFIFWSILDSNNFQLIDRSIDPLGEWWYRQWWASEISVMVSLYVFHCLFSLTFLTCCWWWRCSCWMCYLVSWQLPLLERRWTLYCADCM